MIPKIAPVTTDFTVNSAIRVSGATKGLKWGCSAIAIGFG
jgi:hypothetical protein